MSKALLIQNPKSSNIVYVSAQNRTYSLTLPAIFDIFLLMVETRDRLGLYSEFAKNRQRSAFRRVVPFVANMSVDMPVAIASLAHDAALTNYLGREYPEATTVTALALTVSLGITSIGAYIQYLDITGVNSPNGKLAVEISHAEGRNPQTKQEIKREIERVKRTADAAKGIAPSPENLLYLDINYRWTRFRSRRKPEVIEEGAISDRNFRRWAVRATEKTEFGYLQDPQVVTDSLLIADRQWAEIIDDPKQQEYRKRHGLLMRDEIRRKLAEQFEVSRSRGTVIEGMSARERGGELKALISGFPENTTARISSEISLLSANLEQDRITVEDWYARWEELNNRWDDALLSERKNRDQSPEKKELFERLRSLIAYSPTTRGFQEVLLRELDFQYNIGLEMDQNGTPGLNEVLVKMATDADPFGNTSLFDSEQAEENERKLYAIVSERHKAKWNPWRNSAEDVPNRVLRWVKNRKEDAFELIGFGLGKLAPLEPKLDRSWKRQYRAKYKKPLKPLV